MLLEPETVSLVVRFSANSFRPFLKDRQVCRFEVHTGRENRNSLFARNLRYFSARLFNGMASQQKDTSKAELELDFIALIAVLFHMGEPKRVDNAISLTWDAFRDEITRMTQFMEEHFNEKLTLENIAEHFGYNRTYLSTFLKKFRCWIL